VRTRLLSVLRVRREAPTGSVSTVCERAVGGATGSRGERSLRGQCYVCTWARSRRVGARAGEWDARVVKPIVVLIPSVLLGPATWESTARVLERRGRQVRVPSLQCVANAAKPYWPTGVAAIAESAACDPVILVSHSNSGLYMPSVMAALGEQVRGAVFVDAALPSIGSYAHRDFLESLAGQDGLLPPWTSWWDESAVVAMFPDDQVRARVEAEQMRLPLAYYDHLPPTPASWDRASPCAYIWFGEPYDAAAEWASANGWPIAHVPGRHLHMLVDPEAVSTAVMDLAGDWS
jgi:pimeloyl-ACP methyl ester carboxylesterase